MFRADAVLSQTAMSGEIFELAGGVTMVSALLAAAHGFQSFRAHRLHTRLTQLLSVIDPASELKLTRAMELRGSFALDGRACAVEAVASPGWTTRWALRMGGPMSAIMTLLGQKGSSTQGTLHTGDGRFDQMFAVNAAAPMALRVLSDRVRAALVELPPVMLEPRLSVDLDGVELAWHGDVRRAALEQGHGLLALVCEEFNAMLPLR